MLEKFKANILFTKLLERPNIDKAYAMVEPTDSWYDTITKVHHSLNEIQKLPQEIVAINSHDNLTLKGVYYPSPKEDNTQEGKLTVICVHGYTSHAEREWAFPGLFYLSLGYNVLIPYQRAHGISEGKYISFGALEHLDMLAWVKKVNEMNPNDKIIIHGLSMGGGIALNLTDKEMKNVKGIIADAPSVSIKSFFENIAKEVFKKDSGKVAFFAMERFRKEFGVDAEEFESMDIVSNSKYPILLSAGSNEHLEELFAMIQSVNPQITEKIILPDCNHGNGMYKQTELYQNAIREFLKKVI